jgi:hypothetical protein
LPWSFLTNTVIEKPLIEFKTITCNKYGILTLGPHEG